jgi:hypothetical protein
MFFPNLVVALAYASHLDLRFETFASAILLFESVALIIWTHRRRSPATPLLWYCPVAILMVTWAQYENTLWGFQIAWYMVLICLMGTLAVLKRREITVVSLTAAAGLAVIGSYSSLQWLLTPPEVKPADESAETQSRVRGFHEPQSAASASARASCSRDGVRRNSARLRLPQRAVGRTG